MDASNNLVTESDPGFEDYSGGNFKLKKDSDVYSRIDGFPEIDFENMGNLSDVPVGVSDQKG